MPDIQFRGFVASPVAGTPQGLAVYQNGMRINEAFGDTVNWDLIPTAAIRSVTVVTNNPAFGLNALGGAVNVQMKNGFSYQGAEINTMGGSFGRIQSSAQYGKQIDNFSVYGALEGLRDNGFRNFSESAIRRFYGDVGYRTDSSEFHLNMGVANNNFGAAATVPVELLQNYWGATYTTPQTTDNKRCLPQSDRKGRGHADLDDRGSARVRAFRQKTVDGNPTATEPCDADPALLCFNDDTAPANGLNGVQLANPFPDTRCWGRSTGQQPVRRRPGRPCRQPIPTSCSGTTTSSWSAPVSTPASPASGPARNWARSVQTTSSAAAAYFSVHPALRFRSARSRFEPPTDTPDSMRSTRST